MSGPIVNIARYIPEVAAQHPKKRAVLMPAGRDSTGRRAYSSLSFEQLDAESSRYGRGLLELGVGRGTRTALMVKPSLDFFSLTFALFRIGAVPILIDPGMGVRNLIAALREVEPEAFVGISLAHALRTLHPRSFPKLKTTVTVGRRWWWGGPTLRDITHADGSSLPPVETSASEMAAILFTTGSTGPPKGTVYTHGIFDTQVKIIRDEFGIGPADTDLPAFPLFALFSTALGATAVIPDMDPTRPAKVKPALVLEAIADHDVTYSFGSPAFWKPIAEYCLERGLRPKTLRRVLMAGAPVSPQLIGQLSRVLPERAEISIPYGATESLPVSWISGREILEQQLGLLQAEGAGTPVGRPLSVNELRIIKLENGPIANLDQTEPLPTGAIGEIIVRGPVVTERYFGRERDTLLAKIRDPATGAIWHRMGDLGYLDAEGRLWFCGRKAHRVETAAGTLHSVRCEAIYNQHPRVARSALVGLGKRGAQEPVMVIELRPGLGLESRLDQEALERELLLLGKRSPLTRAIERLLFHPSFPVDIRHNAKIRREALAVWAEELLEP